MGYYTRFWLKIASNKQVNPEDLLGGKYRGRSLSTMTLAELREVCDAMSHADPILEIREALKEINAVVWKRENFEDEDRERYIWSARIKWYEHVNDMCEISSRFPDTLFTLDVQEEKSGGLWVKYFYGGKCIATQL